MPYVTIAQGLTLTIPTNGTRNWGTTLRSTTWTKISSHDHTGSGNGVQIGTNAIVDHAVTQVKLSLNGFGQQSTLTPAGTTQTVNFNLGNVVPLDLGSASGDVTLTLSNPATGIKYVFFIIQGATPRMITWPAACKWPGAVPPLLSELADDGVCKVEMYYDGTVYRGDWELHYS